jgi:peptidoglycan/xylan/chitin deacetylase (PgdA/CDA1 family)
MEVKKVNKTLTQFVIYISELPGIKQLIQRRLKKYYTILLYHRIEPELFDEHLTYLLREYKIIPLSYFEKQIQKNEPELPRNSLIITFDDGWASNYQLLPVLKKHNVKITIFLIAGLVNTNRKLWNIIIRDAYPNINKELKEIPNKEKNRILKEKFNIEQEFPERTILNYKEIHEMQTMVEFQSHSMHHPILPQCTDDELEEELIESKKLIEKITKKSVYAFAYPYNRAGEREKKAALRAGYKICRTGKGKLNNFSQDPLMLRSIPINRDTSISELKLLIAKGKLRTILNPN